MTISATHMHLLIVISERIISLIFLYLVFSFILFLVIGLWKGSDGFLGFWGCLWIKTYYLRICTSIATNPKHFFTPVSK